MIRRCNRFDVCFKLSRIAIPGLRSYIGNLFVTFRCFVFVEKSGDGSNNFLRVDLKAWVVSELVEQ